MLSETQIKMAFEYACKLDVFSIKPGISGLWQVSGRNNLSYKKRVELDIIYSENISFLLDIKIFVKTIYIILFPYGKGAF